MSLYLVVNGAGELSIDKYIKEKTGSVLSEITLLKAMPLFYYLYISIVHIVGIHHWTIPPQRSVSSTSILLTGLLLPSFHLSLFLHLLYFHSRGLHYLIHAVFWHILHHLIVHSWFSHPLFYHFLFCASATAAPNTRTKCFIIFKQWTN